MHDQPSKCAENNDNVNEHTYDDQEQHFGPPPRQQEKEEHHHPKQEGVDRCDEEAGRKLSHILAYARTKNAMCISSRDGRHHAPSCECRDERQQGQNHRDDDDHPYPEINFSVVLVHHVHPHLRRNLGRIEQYVELGPKKERHEDHVRRKTLRHVTFQVIAVVHRPSDVATPDGKMVDGNQVLSSFEEPQQ